MDREPRVGEEEPPEPVFLSDFVRGLLVGIMLAAAVIGFMAAGSLSQNPVVVIDALLQRGVSIDPRIQRLAPAVRRSLLCVSLNVLMEARGEPNAGQIAVAWVTRTRSAERDLSPCEVVFEKMGAAQFSWSAYPIRRIVQTAAANAETFLEAQDWAWKVMVEDVADPTHGANHFWAHRSIRQPPWARLAAPDSRVVIGGHTFIRIPHRRSPWATRNGS
jgi:N-acetylmuramoyl-L-alanine amidase